MMLEAGFSAHLKRLLWSEAINTAELLSNISANSANDKCPDEIFYGRKPKLYDHLIEFGTPGHVTIRKKIFRKFEIRSVRCIMVGYATDASPGTYRMYNEHTNAIILS